MAIAREFLNWDRPALPAAASYLLARYRSGDSADMEQVVVVVPGSRAGRRLLEILVDESHTAGVDLIPPRICTVGELPELLYVRKRPFASELTQRLAWVEALRHLGADKLRNVVASPPEEADVTAWLELARSLASLHQELASDELDFAKVLAAAGEIEGFSERPRWQALCDAQTSYLDSLDSLDLWDRQTARLVAIRESECVARQDIVLVGMVDTNRAVRSMLDQVADRVTALIFAPHDLAAQFDSHGCLVPDAWAEATLDIAQEQVHVVDKPADQAAEAVRCLSSYGGRYAADEIVVGVADERLVPHVERQLRQCHVPCRWGPGRPLAESAPLKLLAAAGAYLESRRYADFAALVRHPDVDCWLSKQGAHEDSLTALDAYFADCLPSRIDDAVTKDKRASRPVRDLYRAASRLLVGCQGPPRRLADWSAPIQEPIKAVYGDLEFDRDNPSERAIYDGCRKLAQLIAQVDDVPEPLQPDVGVGHAIRLILEQASADAIAPPADSQAIEILGWLELPLDDAPAVVVCGFNEGCVPQAKGADLFLPDGLRSRLKLEDNTRRFARDAYALQLLLRSRERVDLVVGRRDTEQEPLVPSPLLFAADGETAARRALAFFRPVAAASTPLRLPGALVAKRTRARLPVPRPQPLAEPVTSLSSTGFRDYLACPYRFYLSHMLKLRPIDDQAEELDGAAFGRLLHEVLLRFGRSDTRDSTDVDDITAMLNDALDTTAAEMYGVHALAPLQVQIEQLRLRLEAFAALQAGRASQGWRIEDVEVEKLEAVLDVDGQPFTVTGRIDRIDVNQNTGEHVVFDYKSGDSAKSPRKAHLDKNQWVDLQLPLYRHLARELGIDNVERTGYIVLPKDVTEVDILLDDWTDEELLQANESAFDVIRQLRAGVFWPPADLSDFSYDDWADICQSGVFDRLLEDEGDAA